MHTFTSAALLSLTMPCKTLEKYDLSGYLPAAQPIKLKAALARSYTHHKQAYTKELLGRTSTPPEQERCHAGHTTAACAHPTMRMPRIRLLERSATDTLS